MTNVSNTAAVVVGLWRDSSGRTVSWEPMFTFNTVEAAREFVQSARVVRREPGQPVFSFDSGLASFDDAAVFDLSDTESR